MNDGGSGAPMSMLEGRRARQWRWILLVLGAFAVIVVLRLGLGVLFGGTQDQRDEVRLFEITRRGLNPYVASRIIAWPPFWWGVVAFWSSTWELIGSIIPGWTRVVSPSIFLKCLYFLFEFALAWMLGTALHKRRRARNEDQRDGARLGLVLAFLWMPATWTITALHGNFDVIPSLFTFAAFLLLANSKTDANARRAAFLLGLAIMSRTFPVLFALPLVVFIWRSFGLRRASEAGFLIAGPTILSFAVLAFISPQAIERILNYRGVLGGWWGLGGIARLFVSDGFAIQVVEWNLLAFYPLILGLACVVSVGLWNGRIKILDAGLLLVLGMFCLAPTISLQNFYFFLPWAFWFAVDRGDRNAKVLLWLASINLFLIYVVVPDSLVDPYWFQQAYAYEAGGIAPRIPSPEWLVDLLHTYSDTFKRPTLAFGPFNQNVLRMPVWVVLWWWFARTLHGYWRKNGTDARAIE
jgi:hypothetical protein